MSEPSGFGGDPTFATTRWSRVLAAGGGDAPEARDALEELAGRAWYPLYAHLRRRGHGVDAARDLVQGFFCDLLVRGDLARADPARGRFRTFLLGSLEHFVAKERRRERALKRGGGRAPLSLDLDDAEARFRLEPADPRTPETAFAAAWARELLDDVVATLEQEHRARGKQEVFAALVPCLGGSSEGLPYATIGERLGASEGAVKVAVHRLRGRFRQLLRARVRETLACEEELEDELRALFDALGAGGSADPV